MDHGDICTQIVDLQRQRVFSIKSQSRNDRSTESFIARAFGYTTDMPEAESKAFWKKVMAFRRAVEKAGKLDAARLVENDEFKLTLSEDAVFASHEIMRTCVPIILNNVVAREIWDKHRARVETEMRIQAAKLPVKAYVESVRGFGLLGLAVIVGEANDLINYATKERLWKRLGLGVIEGFRQGNPGGCREPDGPKATAEQWIAHGFSPQRRAEIWAITDSMFRHQWRGAKVKMEMVDGVETEVKTPGYPVQKYGEIYAARKALTVTREGWSNARRENDARRIMAKALIMDLHKAWHKAVTGIEPVSLPYWGREDDALDAPEALAVETMSEAAD